MSKPFIVQGDKTDHGGAVTVGSPFTDIDGKPVARQNDPVSCPNCGPTVIASGDPTCVIDGMPVARHGDKTACGATLISGQVRVFVDSGGGGSGAPAGNSDAANAATTATSDDAATAASADTTADPSTANHEQIRPASPVRSAHDDEMALSTPGEEWLKAVETLALEPYDDQVGPSQALTEWVEGATIGYGHLIAESEWDIYKDGITEEQAEALFQADVAPFVNAVNDAITVDVEQHEFDAMVMLAYNIGSGSDGFSGSSVAKLVNDPDANTSYESLEDAWKAWKRSQGKVNRGLINRRAAEWNMYSQGIYRHW